MAIYNRYQKCPVTSAAGHGASVNFNAGLFLFSFDEQDFPSKTLKLDVIFEILMYPPVSGHYISY